MSIPGEHGELSLTQHEQLIHKDTTPQDVVNEYTNGFGAAMMRWAARSAMPEGLKIKRCEMPSPSKEGRAVKLWKRVRQLGSGKGSPPDEVPADYGYPSPVAFEATWSNPMTRGESSFFLDSDLSFDKGATKYELKLIPYNRSTDNDPTLRISQDNAGKSRVTLTWDKSHSQMMQQLFGNQFEEFLRLSEGLPSEQDARLYGISITVDGDKIDNTEVVFSQASDKFHVSDTQLAGIMGALDKQLEEGEPMLDTEMANIKRGVLDAAHVGPAVTKAYFSYTYDGSGFRPNEFKTETTLLENGFSIQQPVSHNPDKTPTFVPQELVRGMQSLLAHIPSHKEVIKPGTSVQILKEPGERHDI